MAWMRSRADHTKMLVFAGILTALALALSLIDTAVTSLFAFLPGFRLGLANIAALYALYTLGLPWALAISIARCVLTAVFSGQATMFLFSIMGAVGSTLLMGLLRNRLSVIKVSICGGITHNLLQLLAAVWITAAPGIGNYLPVLIILGTLTGFLIGWLCTLLLRRLHPLSTHAQNSIEEQTRSEADEQ